MSDSKHILEQSQLLQKELEEKRHYLHQHPEVGFELNKTRTQRTFHIQWNN